MIAEPNLYLPSYNGINSITADDHRHLIIRRHSPTEITVLTVSAAGLYPIDAVLDLFTALEAVTFIFGILRLLTVGLRLLIPTDFPTGSRLTASGTNLDSVEA